MLVGEPISEKEKHRSNEISHSYLQDDFFKLADCCFFFLFLSLQIQIMKIVIL